MLIVLICLSLATLAAPVLTSLLGARAFLGLALVPAGGLVWVFTQWPTAGGPVRTERLPWAPPLHMDLDLRLTPLAAIMSVLVLGIGAAILVYCAGYFAHSNSRKLPVFAAELVAFMAAMFGLVTSDNTLLMYTFWELTSVLSFLLVGYYAERATSRRAATQALLVTTLGGLAMLVGLIALGEHYHTYLLSETIARASSGSITIGVEVAVALILLGALSKSAIVPFHFWLPGAMAAPTPVSGYLHAAAMVKAGVFLVGVLAPAFADLDAWRVLVLGLGLFSMLLAGWRALREFDLKLILAFGTVSQLGFLMVLMGVGGRDVALAATAMLIAHALFKATLFMVVGIVDHATGTRDIRRLSRLGRAQPVLALIAAVAAASMAGLPPLAGFVGKEAALETLMHAHSSPSWVPTVLVAGVAIGSVLTMAYSIRFLWGAFGDKGQARPSSAVAGMHAPDAGFLAAPAFLALCCLAVGLAARPLDRLLSVYADAEFPASAHPYHLALWHGVNTPLALTAAIVVLGIAIAQPESLLQRLRRKDSPLLGNADRLYDAALRAADWLSLRMTQGTQRGSLPLTQATILVTLVALPVAVLAAGTRAHGDVHARLNLAFAPIALVMCAAALTATVLRNRLATVLVVGVTGYGCGMVFALYGAPDLALTQFLVETVTLVVFVLVLRKLPPEAPIFGNRPTRAARALLGVAVALMAIGVGIAARIARTAPSVADRLPGQAYEFGYGHNTVNVILVDIRAWDTFGEVSVLLVAATGVASLVFRNRRFGSAPRVADVAERVDVPADSGTTWLRGSVLRDPRHRSLVLEVTSRLVFPTIMVLSLYFFFAGHNNPGGGFAGGLTAGLALVLRYLAGGRYEIGETIPLDAGKILGTGLLLSASGAVVSLLLGAPALSSTTLSLDLPVFGHVKLVTVLIFDAGVYLIVVGLVLDVLRSLGARLDLEGPAGSATSAIPVQRATGPLNPGGRA
ncbi:Na+/H+ antiporter subunit A [Tsukamurella sp. 8F]|uniref:Na+/H+ antiporter subunit A n=1 Tax=unclassified Tsukamurella TaxID=2633480 RepID=UPI0023B900B4|nr:MULTISPECIES: Na+/H+ antiporter subunit A [unclassified Tsukamurella]MDF0529471.1 Na+/H+ antiporter subunit A [Tsukamurella sp. 8J]MDF0585841.1 Na+/H+ antiporter subunit A [Tsukamurella sp. 8F]